ncbi:hypothetical protein FB45DRAFT_1051386 [Roridomyces roridus]|uniref:MYND-type domain-containing protein n=1 Tax=Roridomyces roridus TaxID=1738132 RepID=A0AAD7CEH0_9AGAR|nr:hypothetical protein FB45DRAFT_1051386 [Roridomyces roridus]
MKRKTECQRKLNHNSYGPRECDLVVRNTRRSRENLCDIQLELTRVAGLFWVGYGNVQQRWMSETPEKRGDIILASLIHACSAYADLNNARHFCDKETNVESHRRDGQLFLNPLEEMMIQNPTTVAPDTPIYVAHPGWDALTAEKQVASNELEELALAAILAERNRFIGFVLCFTLRPLLDFPLPRINVNHKPAKPKSNSSHPAEDAVRMLYGDEMAEGLKKALRENEKADHIQHKEVYAKRKEMCRTCGKENDTTTKYPRCKRGWDTVQRQVSYCSSECQKIDWKARHKKECGRLLQLEDLTTPAREQLEESPRIGPPISGFKRPAALLCQVSQLNQLSSDYDYLIMEIGPVYFSFNYPPIRTAFRTCRDKALTTGDRRTVAVLTHFLLYVYDHEPRPQKFGVRPKTITDQISNEFNFPEILRAVNEMDQRMYRGESDGLPPLIFDAGVSDAEWMATPAGWVDIGIVPLPS